MALFVSSFEKDGLNEYLQKCEIEFIARHGGGVIPMVALCGFKNDKIVDYLKLLGFKVKKYFTADSEWVLLTNGINVCLDDGFCID